MKTMRCNRTEVPNIEKKIHVMLKCDEIFVLFFVSERLDFYFLWLWTIHRA